MCADTLPKEQIDLKAEVQNEGEAQSQLFSGRLLVASIHYPLFLPNGIQIFFSPCRPQVTQEKRILSMTGSGAQAEAVSPGISASDCFVPGTGS